MKQINQIFQTDYLQEPERLPPVVKRDWYKWLQNSNHDPDAIEVLASYADALLQAGVDLTNLALIETITGHLSYLEDAILFTLSKQDLDDATAYLIGALRSQGRLWKHRRMKPQSPLPVYQATDWQPSPPPPGYFQSVKQMLLGKHY